MTQWPKLRRRDVMLGGLSAGLAGSALTYPGHAKQVAGPTNALSTYGLVPGDGAIEQTASLQAALDDAARTGTPLSLPPGIYKTGRLHLKSGSQIHGVPGHTILRSSGEGIFATAGTDNVRLSGLVLDGRHAPLAEGDAILTASQSTGLDIANCAVLNSGGDGMVLRKVSGRIADCELGAIKGTALFSEDAGGLEIGRNRVHDCGDNGILVWRSEQGEDGTIVSGNRIERIAAKSGGSGQHGNGINVFRAGSVLVTHNRITDCAYSAIRSNAGSNCQMIANSCTRLGEVALYAEFGFQGAVIANNIVDTAATGISVTNFNEGGRLAVVQGNLIRNLFLRKIGESRGSGIAVEADTTVFGNVVEGAPAYGIIVGWGDYMRDVNVTGNVIRDSHIGIGVAANRRTGKALITDNIIDGTRDGAIRAMKGPTPVGPDLSQIGADAYPNLAVYANVRQ